MAGVSGVFRRPHDVAVVLDGGIAYLGLLPSGPISVLQGTAALIWASALDQDGPACVAAVAEVAGVEPDVVRADTEAFLDELVGRGLLACER